MNVSKKKRGEIYYKYGGHCAYCGEKLEPFGRWQIDHLIPKKLGGEDDIDNLVAACSACNRSKHSKSLESWREYIREKIVGTAYLFGCNIDKYIKYTGSERKELHEFRQQVLAIGEALSDSLVIEFYMEKDNNEQ
jgi:hypothetical protein